MIIEIPKITDYIEINNLAKQVHRLHVKWRPDLYLDIDEVIKKEDLKEKIQSNEIIVAKMQNETLAATADSGEDVAEFFKAIYLGVKEIIDSIE